MSHCFDMRYESPISAEVAPADEEMSCTMELCNHLEKWNLVVRPEIRKMAEETHVGVRLESGSRAAVCVTSTM